MPIIHSYLQKIKVEGIFYNLFYEASITLIPKPNESIKEGEEEKEGEKEKEENYRSVILINLYTEVLNRILTNQIQQCIKLIIHLDCILFLGLP